MTADQLRRDPQATLRRYWTHAGLADAPHAFSWDRRVPKGWEAVQDWHGDVLQSGSIRPLDRGPAPVLAQPYADHAAYHAPAYARLKEIAHAQAHQK